MILSSQVRRPAHASRPPRPLYPYPSGPSARYSSLRSTQGASSNARVSRAFPPTTNLPTRRRPTRLEVRRRSIVLGRSEGAIRHPRAFWDLDQKGNVRKSPLRRQLPARYSALLDEVCRKWRAVRLRHNSVKTESCRKPSGGQTHRPAARVALTAEPQRQRESQKELPGKVYTDGTRCPIESAGGRRRANPRYRNPTLESIGARR